ncbi:MAG: bifunctional methylenetetrahydrofolate dehydrogenase/methenyltetrahydrofolate cyclohydrolase FolD [Deltaproteobacteria bacterium]|nr:MAG: bifunctional methylenetetrahydrofolate dehydrogenase/methenyltetrahydrofolate cyclohydrolase FolD [Deltaproteobacteria bacterium]
MSAEIIDGRAVAAKVREEVLDRVAALAARGVTPGLAMVLVGNHPPSEIYVRLKAKDCEQVGIASNVLRLPADAAEEEVLSLIDRLNADPRVHGILVQMPLPNHLDPKPIVDRVHPYKDVDGLHPTNVGWLQAGHPALLACTPQGVMRLLREYEVPTLGSHAVVLGRSAIVGRPMSWLMLRAHATVTTCHRHTADPGRLAREADILISAVGIAGLVKGDWIKPGAVVIDVGITRLPDGRVVGDVDFEPARERARLITPVPGGVGPMTRAMLLTNTCLAAERMLQRTLMP